jgi:hypothetical protein
LSNEHGRVLCWFYASSTCISSRDNTFILEYRFSDPGGMAGKSFEAMLNDTALQPLIMSQTSLSTPPDIIWSIPGNESGWDTTYGEDPVLSMYSSFHDIAIAGIAILSSSLISPAATRRWLKPISLTSNLVNSQGLPWEIYAAVGEASSPVTEIYTVIGSIWALELLHWTRTELQRRFRNAGCGQRDKCRSQRLR